MDENCYSNGDNTRASWTPPQDLYFIDLLLNQASRGNKVGNLFSRQAWAEMIARFNAKFGFQYDIDVLKNRYKRMRKQYNEMKNIVDQSAFKWDEARQMVTADDNAWDEYIKAHPDMQMYRTKVVPFYKDLCIICGHTIADGRYSLSCFDVDFDDNEEKIMDDNSPSKGHKKINWSLKMDRYFLQLMLEEVHKGNKIHCTFKKKAWLHMIMLFNTNFGSQYSRVVLKNRYNILRKQCINLWILLAQKGFRWDETKKMVIADACVWNKYIKAHPSFRMYRNKPMPCYEDMCIICGNEASVKNNPLFHNSSSDKGIPGKNIGGEAKGLVRRGAVGDACKEALGSVGGKKLSDQHKKGHLETPRAFQQCKEDQRNDQSMADALQEMAVAVTSLTKEKENQTTMLIKDVIDTLQAIPGIDEELLLDACDFLEDERMARMFLALDAKLRKKWLMRKLRP